MELFAPSVVKGAAVVAFMGIQSFVAVMTLVLRYHFKVFSVPNDPRIALMVKIMTYGSFLGFIVAGTALYAALWF